MLSTNVAEPGSLATVFITVRSTAVYSASLAFKFDPTVLSPDTLGGTAFIRSHAFDTIPTALVSWAIFGDSVFVSMASNQSVNLFDNVLVELAFKVVPTAGAGTVASLNWGASTRLNEVITYKIDWRVTVEDYVLWGDATANGAVSSLDASIILQHAVRIPVAIALVAADVSGDGHVLSFDASWVLQKVADMTVVFPVEGGPLPKTLLQSLSVVWQPVPSGWSLVASSAGGVFSATLDVSLPQGAVVTGVKGGLMSAYRQDGTSLTIALVKEPSANPVLVTLLFETQSATPPTLVSGVVNESATVTVTTPEFALRQNAPNPFNPSTSIDFSLSLAGNVSVTVHNLSGQTVRTLISGDMTPGNHSVVWNGKDTEGRSVASGIYILRPVSSEGSFVRRMVLMR